MSARLPFAALVLIPLAAACGGSGEALGGKPPKAELEAVASKRVFFGHQSVGRNMLEGIAALEAESGGSGPRIVEDRSGAALATPALAHATIGTNGAPSGKIRDFVAIVEGGVGSKADVALMKFCYVDITGGTDIDGLFAEYKDALARLRAEYPRTAFPMVTVPLMTIERGPKAFVKRILGMPLNGTADNAARERFNELVRRACPDGKGLFDLARIESTGADGSELRYSYKGQGFPALCPEYSSDGGHLNERGARVVASSFLTFLGKETARPRSPD
jgi:hypothetical protein